MPAPKSFLQIIVRCTLSLLFTAAFLIVLGIFNATLGWDIVGPKLQAFLMAVFWSCVTLSACGTAITMVVGIQEIAASFTALTKDKRSTAEIKPRTVAIWIGSIVLITLFAVGALAAANHRVTVHRTTVFKRLAKENAESVATRATLAVQQNRENKTIGHELYASIRAIEGLSFIRNVTVYFADPDDELMLKSHNPSNTYRSGQEFHTILAAREYEKAILKSLSGNSSDLEELNTRMEFTFYFTLREHQEKPVAILRIDGNSRENFREYKSIR